MPLLCTIVGHNPAPQRHQNQGLEFSLCHHCGCDLIRLDASADWIEVPAGYRVSWRETAPECDSNRRLPALPARGRKAASLATLSIPRGRPIRGVASMMGMFAALGQLVEEGVSDTLGHEIGNGTVIRLPHRKAGAKVH